MNCLLLSVLLIVIIGQVYGRIVNFSLITFGEPATVTVNGKEYQMKNANDAAGIQSASIILPDEDLEYQYSINGKPEGFNRTIKKGELTTYNEFVGRKETLRPLKGMGYPEDKPQWTRSIGKTSLFDDSYIPTIIFDTDSKEFFSNPLITGDKGTYNINSFTIIIKDDIYTENNVQAKAQNRYQDKFQFRVKLEKKFHHRGVFKFRSNSADPAFFRQSLYADMHQAIGNPVHNQIVVRCYLRDGTPIGLYLMIEVTSSKSFIKSQFYGDELTGKITAPEKLGTALDCSTGADFKTDQSLGPFKYDSEKGESNEQIRELITAMHEVDVEDEAAVKKFSKEWFDLDVFFKSLALEYLTGDWDSYWFMTTNFVIYDDPNESTKNTKKFYFIDQDFDLTFGIGLNSKVNTVGHAFPEQSYKELVGRTWCVDNGDGPDREAINLFLKGGVTKTMFENHLIDIVKHVFNPVACGRRLQEYTSRYADEIQWDYDSPRLWDAGSYASERNKERYIWTMNDFYEGMEDVKKSSAPWGLKEWIKMRADSVAQEFNFEYDKTPLDPVVRVIEKNTETFNLVQEKNNTKEEKSGSISISSKTSSFAIVLLTFLVGYLL